MSQFSTSPRAAFIFGLVFVAALGLRLHGLGASSFWLDEIYQANCASGPISQIWSHSPSNKPPLDYYIQSMFIGRPPDEFRARFHACVFGAYLVVLFGMLGLLVGGWRFAAILIGLTLSLPVLIRYSQEGRPYSLLLLSETAFLLILWRMLLSANPGGVRWWMKLTAAIVLCMWSHFVALWTCVLSLALVGAWALARSDTRKAAWVRIKGRDGILIVCFFGPIIAGGWLPLQARAMKAVAEPAYAPFNAQTWKPAIAQFLDIYSLGYDWYQHARGGHLILIALIITGWIGWSIRKNKALFANFCMILFVANFFGMFLFYRAIDHWMEVRYTLGALPAAILLAGMGIETVIRACAGGIGKLSGIANENKTRIENIVTAAICAPMLCGYIGYVNFNRFQKPDWRGLGLMFKGADQKDLAILAADGNDTAAVNHYLKRCGIEAEPVDLAFNARLMEACLLFHPNAFTVRGTMGVTPPGFVEELDRLPLQKIDPGPLYLDVRRMPSQKDMLARANLADDPCPLLLNGWSAPERIGNQKARAMIGGRGTFVFECGEPRDLTIAFSVLPAGSDPSIALSLAVNGAIMPAVPLHGDWNLACWKLSKNAIKAGRNVLELSAIRTPAPLRIEPGKQDSRLLPVWVRDIEVIDWR